MKKTPNETEALPFSALLISPEGIIRQYNDLAKRSFPGLVRGMKAQTAGLSPDQRGVISGACLKTPCDYYAVSAPFGEKEGTLIVFLSDPGFPRDAVLLAALEEGDFALRRLEEAAKKVLSAKSVPAGKETMRSVYEQTRFARRRASVALYYLRAILEPGLETPRQIAPAALLKRLGIALNNVSYRLTVEEKERCLARLPFKALGMAVLDLFAFAEAFEGTLHLHCTVSRRGDEAVMRFEMEDRQGFFRAFSHFINSHQDGAALFLPLLSASALCRQNGLGFQFFCQDGVSAAEIAAPASPLMPEQFLGARDAELDVLVREIFERFFPDPEI